MIVLLLVAIGFLANGISARSTKQEREFRTVAALAKAKEALIAYAVRYSDTHPNNVPGYLPCPDVGTSEGTTAASCGTKNVSSIRRLPWRELGLEVLRDGSGECLWYVVSGTFKYSPKTDLMNWDNTGLIEIVDDDGTTLIAGGTPEKRAVAAVIAPGAPVASQNRTMAASANECGGNYSATNYLEIRNGVNNTATAVGANAISRLIAGKESETFNDRIIYITADEIFSAIRARKDFRARLEALTGTIASCLGKFGELNGSPINANDNRLPWPAPVNLASFTSNTSYDDSATGARKSGRLPFRVAVSKSATANQMSGQNLLSNVAFSNCTSWTTDDANWYSNWKDHFFYYVSGPFAPISTVPTALPCTSCLTVNGTGNYAAIVLFAGEKTTGQTRNTVTDKGIIGNYLEGRNSTSHPNISGASNLEKSTATNDFLQCVTFDTVTRVSQTFPCP